MKVKYRIPTTQYGFVEVEEEANLDPEQIRFTHDLLVDEFKAGLGLSPTEYAKAYDTYRLEGKIEVDTWVKMSREQQYAIDALKKSLRRNNK
jgi:hypothetical protein